MNTLEDINPYDWNTLAPYYEALIADELTAESAHAWLRRWSDLERVVREAGNAASRAMSENTADESAEKTYLRLCSGDRTAGAGRRSGAEDEAAGRAGLHARRR